MIVIKPDLQGIRQLFSISQRGLLRVDGNRISPPYILDDTPRQTFIEQQ